MCVRVAWRCKVVAGRLANRNQPATPTAQPLPSCPQVIGQAFGNAAMILASGKKGYRYALPNARIMTGPPRMNRWGGVGRGAPAWDCELCTAMAAARVRRTAAPAAATLHSFHPAAPPRPPLILPSPPLPLAPTGRLAPPAT